MNFTFFLFLIIDSDSIHKVQGTCSIRKICTAERFEPFYVLNEQKGAIKISVLPLDLLLAKKKEKASTVQFYSLLFGFITP